MKSSPLLELHRQAGARLGSRPEAPEREAVLTFGDVPAEYEAARTGAVLFDATERGRLTVSGSERAAFLHRLLANEVRALGPGSGNRNLLLSPKGKVRFLLDLAVGEEELELSLPLGTEEPARAALDMYLFTEDVSLRATGSEHAPLDLVGPESGAVLAAALGTELPPALPEHGWFDSPDGTRVTRMRVAGLAGWRVDAGPANVAGLFERLSKQGARPAGLALRDILRVETRSALFGIDVDDNVYPAEACLDDAFSLEKGCYVGQEVAAKIDTYGGLNKRLLRLSIEHGDPVPRGTRLLSDDDEERELGLVTSWAYSFQLDGGNLLAYVKRRNQEPGTSFRLRWNEHALGKATVLEHEPS